jgi:hypothetical protein
MTHKLLKLAPQSPRPLLSSQTAPVEKPAVVAISVIDVVARLDGLAASNPQKLNRKTSIVDLLKLLSLDSSLESRKELATEFGCPKGEDWRFCPDEHMVA